MRTHTCSTQKFLAQLACFVLVKEHSIRVHVSGICMQAGLTAADRVNARVP